MSRRDEWRGGGGRRKAAAPRSRPRGRKGRGRTAAILVAALVLLGAGAAVGVGAVVLGLVPGFRLVAPERPVPGAAADTAPALPPPVAAGTTADTGQAPLGTTPDPAALADAGPDLIAPLDSALGETVYRGIGRCLSCHGAAGVGVPGLGPDLRDGRWLVGDATVASVARIVREGVSPPVEARTAMPGFASLLSEEQIARVAAYVVALSRPDAMLRDPAPPDSAGADSAAVPFPSR